MAEIVRIKDRIARRPAKPVKGRGEAEILFFTGVRYEAAGSWMKPAETVLGTLQQIIGPQQKPAADPC